MPEPPRGRAPQPVQVAPLAYDGLAREPGWGLVLGTGEGPRATRLPLAGHLRSVLIEAAPAGGELVPVRLKTEPQNDRRLRPGTLEIGTGGREAGWRLGVWTAARSAASAVGRDLFDHRFAAESEGAIEGDAPAALLAAGYLAALTGAEVDESATLVGVILPDGSIGPVPEIRRRAAAAAAAGKRRFGVPPGAALEAGDLEVREVADVGAAFALLTGSELPAPSLAGERTLDLREEERALLGEEVARWRERAATHWARVIKMQGGAGAPEDLMALATRAERAAAFAEGAVRAGREAAARARIQEATALAVALGEVWDVLTAARAGRWEEARSALGAEEELKREAAEAVRAAGAEAGGFSAQLARIEGLERAYAAVVWAELAAEASREARRRLGDSDDSGESPGDGEPGLRESDVLEAAVPASLARARARVAIWGAQARPIANGGALAAEISIGDAGLRAAAEVYAALARAHLDAGANSELAARALALGEKESEADGRLAASFLAYRQAARADALRRGFGLARNAKTGLPAGLERQEVLEAILPVARRRARQHARQAEVALGAVPLRARRAYQTAAALGKGNHPLLDVAALASYWDASLTCELAVSLGRHLDGAPRPPGPPGPISRR